MHIENFVLVVLNPVEAKYIIFKNLCSRNMLKGFKYAQNTLYI